MRWRSGTPITASRSATRSTAPSSSSPPTMVAGHGRACRPIDCRRRCRMKARLPRAAPTSPSWPRPCLVWHWRGGARARPALRRPRAHLGDRRDAAGGRPDVGDLFDCVSRCAPRRRGRWRLLERDRGRGQRRGDRRRRSDVASRQDSGVDRFPLPGGRRPGRSRDRSSRSARAERTCRSTTERIGRRSRAPAFTRSRSRRGSVWVGALADVDRRGG